MILEFMVKLAYNLQKLCDRIAYKLGYVSILRRDGDEFFKSYIISRLRFEVDYLKTKLAEYEAKKND